MFKQIQKIISIVVLFTFISTSIKSPSYAQLTPQGIMPALPAPGNMVSLSPEFTPAHLKGLIIHPENPLMLDFIVTQGNEKLTDKQLHNTSQRLIKYFLAALAVPDENQWVNLSPYENDRIIKDDFGKTEMGRDLLAQDYLLKQITASLIYPENHLGQKFWDTVYARAFKQYGNTHIPLNTFNKVWIIPDKAYVYEHGKMVYVVNQHLKVMLEEDYLSLSRHSEGVRSTTEESKGTLRSFAGAQDNRTHTIGSQIVREIVLPALEREVNENKNFSVLRQVYSGMILAAWYKYTLKESLLGKIYANKDKLRGIDQDPKNNEKIYQRYLKAFKKGVFNYIKEDLDKYTHETIPRKYFSGGVVAPKYFGLKGIAEKPGLAMLRADLAMSKDDVLVSVVTQEEGATPADPFEHLRHFKPTFHEAEVLVIGAGGAGLQTAVNLAAKGIKVTVIAKVPVQEAHTRLAQGGIAGKGLPEDNPDLHLFDTVKGGDYIVDQDGAHLLARNGPRVLSQLREYLKEAGMDFDTNPDGSLRAIGFGGHQAKRSLSVSDKTGFALHEAIYQKLLRMKKEGKPIEFREKYFVTEIIRDQDKVLGVVAVDTVTSEVHVFRSKAIVLATGGGGRVFSFTSNTPDNTGDGYALALKAGVPLQDMEFFQFHPTGLPPDGDLISEKARAEGGFLLNSTVLEGPNDPDVIERARFMKNYAPEKKETASRDIVSRAIATEIAEGRGVPAPDNVDPRKNYIYLDLRHVLKGKTEQEQKNLLDTAIESIAKKLGLNPATDLIPIAPTAHYTMGGIPTDLNGRVTVDQRQREPGYSPKTLEGLYAVGEAANVSVHGANRLGTNSLLELFVFGEKTAEAVAADIQGKQLAALPIGSTDNLQNNINHLLSTPQENRSGNVEDMLQELRDLMQQKVGVFRTEQTLNEALTKVREMRQKSTRLNMGSPDQLIEVMILNNMIDVSEIIILSALYRTESRGGHFRNDHPGTNNDEWLVHTTVQRTPQGEIVFGKKPVVFEYKPGMGVPVQKRTYGTKKDLNKSRNPLNIPPINVTKDLRDLLGLPNGTALLVLDPLLENEQIREEIIYKATHRIMNFLENNPADEYVFDLSDPIHPLLKPLARMVLFKLLTEYDDIGDKIVTVRVNDNGQDLEDDLNLIKRIASKVNKIFIRAKTAEDVKLVSERLKAIARDPKSGKLAPEKTIRIEVLLFDPESYQNAGEIAKASDLVNALVMSHTVASDLGISRSLGESLWAKDALRYQRAKAFVAAYEAGVLLIDHVITMRMNDAKSIGEAANKAKEAGASGMRALTPLQAKIFAEVFATPSLKPKEEILADAQQIVTQYEAHSWAIPPEAAGHGLTSSEIDILLKILKDFQGAQLRGDGGIVYDPQGVAEWVDPYSARHFMDSLDIAKQQNKMSAEQIGIFDGIEALYGSDWRAQRLLQVPIEKVKERAQADLTGLLQSHHQGNDPIVQLARRIVQDDSAMTTAFEKGYALGYFGPESDPNMAWVDARIYDDQLGKPGEFPFTRGIFRSVAGRRGGQTPTVRKYASFGTAKEANPLLKQQLEQGATGLSIAFDLPTQNGFDADHLMSRGEVGKVGVSINTLDDMRDLFDGIDLVNKKGELSVSMTINATSPILLAMYYQVAQEKGLRPDQIRGTIQNDVLKEYTARGTYVFPYAATMRLTGDIFQWARAHAPKYNTITFSGYHAREKGASEVQEIAFAISNALQYLIEARKRGLSKDELAGIMGQVAFFMNLKKQTFVEVAKYRALRRIWATLVREAFDLKPQPGDSREKMALYTRASMVRVQSWAGGSDVRFPEKVHDNIIRNAVRTLNASAAGPNAVDGAAFDESVGIPTEFSQGLVIDEYHLALLEKGLTEVTDHMGGAYLLEAETDRIEKGVWEELARIAHKANYKYVLDEMVSDIERQAVAEKQALDTGNIPVVGVNTDRQGEELFPQVKRRPVAKSYDAQQQERLAHSKAHRDHKAVNAALDALETAARGQENLMPFIVNAVKINATVGEISDRLRRVFGVSGQKPWDTKPWVDSEGKTWPHIDHRTTPEVFDGAVRDYILSKAASIGNGAERNYKRGIARGYFVAADMPYFQKASPTEEKPGHFPYTRGIAQPFKPEQFQDINAYIIRENGGDAVQELAISLFFALKEIGSQAGTQKASFANQFRLVLSSGDKFYEEVAKFRVARRLWAKLLRKQGINDPNALQLVLKAKTAFYTLTKDKVWLNVQRAALQAYQAYLGGVQDIEVAPFDSLYAQTEHSALAKQMALDTVAIIKKELGLEGIADPLGGSFLLEATTDDLEEKVLAELNRLMDLSSQKEEPRALLSTADSSGALAVIRDIQERYPEWVTPALAQRIVGGIEQARDRQLAGYTAGVTSRVGTTVNIAGPNPIPAAARADHLLPARTLTIKDLASADEEVRSIVVNGYFEKAQQLSRAVRATLGVNNKFSGTSRLVNGLYAAIVYVNKNQLDNIKTALDISDQDVILTTDQGARLKIVEGTEGQIGSLGLELATQDTQSAMRFIEQRARRPQRAEGRPLKILVAKPGLDGHDRGATTIRDALTQAGFEVFYKGIKQTPQEIVQAAEENHVDVIGLSILSDAHSTHVPEIARLLNERGLNIPIVLGGVIPQEDHEDLLTQAGVGQIYTGETTLDTIVSNLHAWQKWLATKNTIEIGIGNQFVLTLPDGKTVPVVLNKIELPKEHAATLGGIQEPATALAITRPGPLALSRRPTIDGLWDEDPRIRTKTARHFALAGDLLIEAVRRNPVLARHIVPLSSAIGPHDQRASVASAGLAVTPEHFEAIRRLHDNPPLSSVPADVGVNETELEVTMPDGSHRILDILADTADSQKQTLTRHIKANGEGIQQVEVWTDDVQEAAKDILAAAKDRSNGLKQVSEAPQEGANGTKIFFVLVTVENNKKVLAELVQRPSADRAQVSVPGGINLNSKLLKMQIKRDKNGVPLSMQFQDIQNIHIDGLVPIIINIVPVTNMSTRLGLSETKN